MAIMSTGWSSEMTTVRCRDGNPAWSPGGCERSSYPVTKGAYGRTCTGSS